MKPVTEDILQKYAQVEYELQSFTTDELCAYRLLFADLMTGIRSHSGAGPYDDSTADLYKMFGMLIDEMDNELQRREENDDPR